MRSTDDWAAIWLATRLTVRVGGRTLDLDAPSPAGWAAAIAPLSSPVVLVTAWNPQGLGTDRAVNRAANRALRRVLHDRGMPCRPALGRARDGSWAEPGFAVGGLDETGAARLGEEWGQLAVYLIDRREVAVLASDGSFRFVRARGNAGDEASPPEADPPAGLG